MSSFALPLVLLLAIAVIGVIALLAVAAMALGTRSDGDRAPRRIRLIALTVTLGVVVLFIAGLGLQRARPLLELRELRVEIEIPGADIYFGERWMGRDRVEVQPTGEEPWCFELEGPCGRSGPRDVREMLLAALAPGGELLEPAEPPSKQGVSADGYNFMYAAWECLLRRADGTLDSVVVIHFEALDVGKRFAFAVRARAGGNSCLVPVDGAAFVESDNGAWSRNVVRKVTHTQVLTRCLVPEQGAEKLAEHDGRGWWLDRFPPGAEELVE